MKPFRSPAPFAARTKTSRGRLRFARNAAIAVLAAFLLAGTVSCKNKAGVSERKSAQSERAEQAALSESEKVADGQSGLGKSADLDGGSAGGLDSVDSSAFFYAAAHKKFLDDPMAFSPLPDYGIAEGKTAVVASRVCKLYQAEAFDFKSENSALLSAALFEGKYSEPVPFASIVQITGEKIQNADGERFYGMFDFEDNYNFFYPASCNGKSGYIFGADLAGLDADLDSNKVTAELYRTRGRYDAFYPVAGYSALQDGVQESLEKKRLAIQKTLARKYVQTDDMIDEYESLRDNKALSIFVTTDLAAHCQHLIFDRMLQYTEEHFFFPRMGALADSFVEALKKRTDAPPEILKKAISYFEVPQLIIKTAPQKTADDTWFSSETWEERSQDFIQAAKAEYSEAVQADYESVVSAAGERPSAIFGYTEDFSQYRPRGHYNKNPILQTYFKAQMWFGRIHFLIADKEANDSAPTAFLIIDTVQKNPALYEEWKKLFDPITALIGMSDDLSFYETLPIWKEQNISDFSSWAGDKEKVLALMKLCQEKLRPPSVNGNSILSSLYDISWIFEGGLPPTKPPMGWRLFGQRFTYDSYIHDQVSPPRLMTRDVVKGLDVMKVFGSQTADVLLRPEYKTAQGLKEKLDSLQEAFGAYGHDFWEETYYNQVLRQIKTLANFEKGSGFYFAESPLWNIKAMLSSHGTWAELRHDTILYVKQSAAERGGGGDIEPTFRIEPLPKPIHYVEPNLPFWNASISSVQGLKKIYGDFNLLDEESAAALDGMLDLYQKILLICQKEADDLPISDQENNWIPTIASRLKGLVLVHAGNFLYTENNDQLKMACIADVFSNYEIGVCLEVGAANPHRLYVPLNDTQGGKRIAQGYCFSYAEFLSSAQHRWTDEEWKQAVYRDTGFLSDDYMPDWEKECLVDF